MDSTRIASTPLLGLRPLGAAGDRNHPRLTEILATRLGAEHAFLLAEPVPTPDGTRIDWYVPGSNRGVVLASLPENVQAPLTERLARLQGEVRELASRLEQDGPSGAALATGLRNAMAVPGSEFIYAVSVSGQTGSADAPAYMPVLVAWGHTRDGDPAYTGDLKGKLIVSPAATATGPLPEKIVPAAAGSAAAIAPAAERGRPLSWLALLLWLLLAILVGLILWQLLIACGIGSRAGGFFGLSYCRSAASAQADADRGRLLNVVRDLEAQLARRRADCEEADAARIRAVGPERGAQEEAERRVLERGGRQGELQFTLTWEGFPDIDLEVTCPLGETISTRNKTMCGGTLDLDANLGAAYPGGLSETPVEHITWPEGTGAPSGSYQIRVRYFGANGDQRPIVPYRVVVTDRGRPSVTFEGTLPRRTAAGYPEAIHDYAR